MDCATAARLAGMDRQTLCDRVHRYNAEGIAGLCNRPAPGRKPKLTEGQMVAFEQEEDERGGIAAIGRRLDHAEGGGAVGTHAAELAVEIGLPGGNRCDGCGDRVQSSPVRVSNRTAPRSRRACMR